MRVDCYLQDAGMVKSRTEAQRLIRGGFVSVDGAVVTKPAYYVSGSEKVTVNNTDRIGFASRGGIKLAAAISEFGISCEGRMCLDIGASSGGFTDCLLKNGASHVIAADVGSGQIADNLRDDPRVTVMENYNARYMKRDDLEYIPDLIVMDVSFISATYIIPAICDISMGQTDFVCLIKPQFEVGRSVIGKNGVVKDEMARMNAVNKVIDFAISLGFQFNGVIKSPICGGDGNIEYLAHFIKFEAEK